MCDVLYLQGKFDSLSNTSMERIFSTFYSNIFILNFQVDENELTIVPCKNIFFDNSWILCIYIYKIDYNNNEEKYLIKVSMIF